MLPIRKSTPVPRRTTHHAEQHAWVVAVEVRLPSEGTWFAALAASVRLDGLFLSTSQHLEMGTNVILELALPDGAVTVDGVVEPNDDEGPGVRVAFDDLSNEARERIQALHRWNAMSLAELASQVA